MTRTDHWDGGDPADRLDSDLDRMVRGGRPETGAERSGFGPTIERLYGLASDAGITARPRIRVVRPSPGAAKVSAISIISTISRRTIMSGLSTAALVALMLAIAFNAFPLVNSTDPPQMRTASLNQVGLPPASPAATPEIDLVTAPPRPFTREDCDVEPRTREELIDILGTLPTDPWPGDRTEEPGSLDQATFDQLQETLHVYQSCYLFGMTYERAALTSAEELRHQVYSYEQITPYSPTTLEEIVRGWEEIDATEGQRFDRHPSDALELGYILILDPDYPSEQPLHVSDTSISVPAVVTLINGVEVNSGIDQYAVRFVLEDGRWLIDGYPDVGVG